MANVIARTRSTLESPDQHVYMEGDQVNPVRPEGTTAHQAPDGKPETGP